ncbi:AAA family ATPase [Algoriphagus taiwanensis]|uniref:AAA family ATPase n=1 Tax=Algoriphagus taiwanensis TaxID=1445656 RepID=A0ABQ6Q4N2_9BACT|nr:AAA family ATPase [Algoriphagus taiwanensis]
MKSKLDTPYKDKLPGYVELRILCESYPHILFIGKREKDGKSVVLKTLIEKYPKKEQVAGITREFQMVSKLPINGVIKVFDFINHSNGNLAIEMEHFGLSLEDYRNTLPGKKIPIGNLLKIAMELTEILGRIHEKGIVHKDLVPRNVLIDPQTLSLRVIDFSASSELSREHQEFSFPNSIAGSLPYISPEQTGRMNRDIDYRTDYYTLGMSLFEMATGQLPFQAQDPLEWVHCHISKKPPTLREINSEFPQSFSDIIAKLISKNAEDRYQSSLGLIKDFEKVSEILNSGNLEQEIPLGIEDVSGRFQIPQRLYGRDKEIQKLETYFEKTSHGSVEFCLVAGYSGVGKSALVHEFGRTVVRKKGFLIHGKFEQFRQNNAYSALASAFKDLIRQILGEPKASLDRWNQKLNKALDQHGQLIVDLIPELELIIGKQPLVQGLSPSEAQNRFFITFLNFVKVFSQKKHPLVIFMDDLQWSDIPTLNLISRLVSSQEMGYLMLIGAYRDNAVDKAHALTITMEEIRKKRMVETMLLNPLDQKEISKIIEDTLLCPEESAQSLGKVLFDKTGGNPFYSTEVLKDLYEQKIIFFDLQKRTWVWDQKKLENVSHSENVVGFLVKSQYRLPESTQLALQLAACIGATFDLQTLSVINKSSMEKTAADLYEALKANMIIPLHDSYRLVGLSYSQGTQSYFNPEETDAQHINPVYKFQHDRVQQAAYSMIPEGNKKQLHLSIGRLMLRFISKENLSDLLFDVVEHLNQGRSLIKDKEEKKELALLNLEAGIRAKASSAYASALQYLQISVDLLDAKTWESDYELMWSLGEEIQSCYYLTGDQENAEEWSALMLTHAKTLMQKGLVLATRTRQYATTGRMQESIQAAYQGLEILGYHFAKNPSQEDLDQEIANVEINRAGREVASLIDQPEMTDERAKIASQLLMEIFAAAFLSGTGRTFPYLVLKSVNFALSYGKSPESAFSYAAYGMILCGYFENTSEGYQYGKLGVEMIERYGDISMKSRILYVYTMFVHHWSNHWSTMTPWFRKGIETGYQSGDLLYLAYSAQDCIIWDPKLDLETAISEHRKLLKIVADCDYMDSLDSGTLFLQMLKNFAGLTEEKFSLSSKYFDEEICLEGMAERHFMTGIANYHIYKAEIHLLYNDAKGALPHILKQEKLMASVMSLPQLVRFHIVAFLVRSLLLPEITEEERAVYLEHMQNNFAKMAHWAEQCEENFEHLRLLMEAELAGHFGKMKEALGHYEAAVQMAQKHGFIRDEGIIQEKTAQYLIRQGLEKAAEGYLKAAHYLFYRWGAHRKTEDMLETYPQVFESSVSSKSKTLTQTLPSATRLSDDFSNQLLDISSVIRASQVISGELVLEKLLKATLQILLQNAGAQHGYLIEKRDGHFSIQASNGEDLGEKKDLVFSDSEDIDFLPISLINTAIRTNTPIVIANATELNPYSQDPYLIKAKPLSLMCVPLSIHRQWKVAIYLENNLTHSAFTEERVQVIKLLAAQAAISIENARIYEEQEKLLRAQQRFVPDQFLSHLGHSDIAKVKLGESVAMEMSVLFSDIRDFTPLVELLSPESVILLLNQYFSKIGPEIIDQGGFIDSFAGDEILALFAVPASQAVKAGVGMAKALMEFNKESEQMGRPLLNMGIGINTGPLVLGTMGGENRMQCTVLGDTVNLGSRIESLTKVYGSPFLISEQTFKALSNPDEFSWRMVDRVAVKGKAKAVNLYEILDAEEEDRKKAKELSLEPLRSGMEAYFKRNFHEALSYFEKGNEIDPEDRVFPIFISRCLNYLEHPPGKDWQGYEILQHK